MRRASLIALGIVVFLAASLLVARWLNTDSVERAQVQRLLRAQAHGDTSGVLAALRCRDPRCTEVARANVRRLRARGKLRIARYDSGTAHALGTTTAPTRVVWITPGRLTTVQCVLVRRDGNLVAGTSVTLLGLSAPIGRQAGCR